MRSVEEIYQTYSQTVYKYILSRTNNPTIAEELTQETFYQAIRCIDKYDESCKISTWLCAIAKNQILAYQRKNPNYETIDQLEEFTHIEDQTRIETINNLSTKTTSAEDSFMEGYNRVKLMKQLHALEEPYREVMYLRIFGNLSFKEIGEILEKSENWARVTFYRGKDKLRKEVNGYE